MTEQQRDLVQNNHNLIYSFLHQHKLPVEEFYDLAAIGLCHAAMHYDPNISLFSTFAYKCMLSQCMKEVNAKNRAKRIPENLISSLNYEHEESDGNLLSLEEVISSNENMEENAISNVTIQNFKNQLKPKHRQILDYLLEGYTIREIAKKMGCSHQCIFTYKIAIAKQYQKYIK